MEPWGRGALLGGSYMRVIVERMLITLVMLASLAGIVGVATWFITMDYSGHEPASDWTYRIFMIVGAFWAGCIWVLGRCFDLLFPANSP